MVEHPLKTFEKIDPELLNLLEPLMTLLWLTGALRRKVEFLLR